MSYSFSLRAANKQEAAAVIAERMSAIAKEQPAHEADKANVILAAISMLHALPDDESKDVGVSVNGWVSGAWDGKGLSKVGSVSVTINLTLTEKEAVNEAVH